MYTLQQLIELTGQRPRTIGQYIHHGLLPRPTRAGRNTRYGEEHLVRLLVIERLRTEEGLLELRALKKRLDSLTPEELDDLSREGPPSSAPASSPSSVSPSALVPTPSPAPSPAPAAPASPAASLPAWTRHPLAPGVELHVASTAPKESQAVAAEILARWRR